MPTFHSPLGANLIAQIFLSAFFAILFLQSGIDKVLDRRGNLAWLSGHFAKSPFAGFVPLLLSALTVLELSSGLSSALGCLTLLVRRGSTLAFVGAVLSGLTLLALFFGQRLAKEYPGAASLVPYFLVAIVAILALA